jgi:hypothetical protein
MPHSLFLVDMDFVPQLLFLCLCHTHFLHDSSPDMIYECGIRFHALRDVCGSVYFLAFWPCQNISYELLLDNDFLATNDILLTNSS